MVKKNGDVMLLIKLKGICNSGMSVRSWCDVRRIDPSW